MVLDFRILKRKDKKNTVAAAWEAYAKVESRMTREFTLKYCKEDDSIAWDILIKFNSGD